MKKITIVLLMLLMMVSIGCNKEFGITGVAPANGVMSGNEPLTIKGTGFDPNLGLEIRIDGKKCDNVRIKSSTELVVNTPAASKPGPVDIMIIPDNSEPITIKGAFRYLESSSMDIRDLGKRQSLRTKKDE